MREFEYFYLGFFFLKSFATLREGDDFKKFGGIIFINSDVSKGIEIVFCRCSETIEISGSDGSNGNDCNKAAYW